MTRNRKAKEAARAFKAQHGGSYTAAVRATRNRSADPMEKLLWGSIGALCDNLIGEAIQHPGNDSVSGTWMDITLPIEMTDVCVYEIQIDEATMDVQTVEIFEGGTEVRTVSAEAVLVADGLMSKADAIVSAEKNLVEIIDPDFNVHYSQVLIQLDILAEFAATMNPGFESVEDLTFVGAGELDQ